MKVPNKRRFLYRPTENHLGVIYFAGRFRFLAHPNKWRFLLPGLHCVKQEVSLDMRSAEISLKDVMTRDHVAVDVDLKIFYKVDLRQVEENFQQQALRIAQLPGDIWSSLIRTNLTDIVRNTVFIANDWLYLMSPAGSKYLKRALSTQLAERVFRLGVYLNPRFGVSVVNLQPNSVYQKALQEDNAAASLGLAAIKRIRPILEALRQQNPDAAQALLLGILAAVNKSGEVPPIVMPGDFEREFLAMYGNGRNNGRHPQSQPEPSRVSGNNGGGNGSSRYAHRE